MTENLARRTFLTGLGWGVSVEVGIAADVYRNGEQTDHMTFGERGVRSYSVSLQSEA